MMGSGKVVGGHYMNATVTPNTKGDLALQVGGLAAFKRRPTLTADAVAEWKEVVAESRGGAVGAASKVARAALPGLAGKAASAALDSVKSSTHTVQVDWIGGKRSLIQLPDKLFQHLALMLKDLQVATSPPDTSAAQPSTTSSVIGQLTSLAGAVRSPQQDVTEQIAKLAELRDQGVLTDEEFTAKKTELLNRL